MHPTRYYKAISKNAMRDSHGQAIKCAIIVVVISALVSIVSDYATGTYKIPGIFSEWQNKVYEILGVNETVTSAQWSQWSTDLLTQVQNALRPSGFALQALLGLVISIVTVGSQWYWLRLSRGDMKRAMPTMFESFKFFSKVLFLIIVRGVFTLLWSLLFIVPGIVAYYRYSMAAYIMFDEPELSVMECIRKSKEIMRGNKLDLFTLELSFIGWILLSALLTVMIAMANTTVTSIISDVVYYCFLIYISAYMGIAEAAFYNAVAHRETPVLETDEIV